MGDWAIIEPDTGNVDTIVSVNNKADFEEEGWFKGKGLLAVELPSGYSRQQILNELYYEETESGWKSRGGKPAGFYEWTNKRKWELNTVRVMAAIRGDRDIKLAICDWTQLPDAPLTDEKKAEWATYRQALRDVPASVPAETDTNVGYDWPTEPS